MANINVTTNTVDVTVSEANTSNLVVTTTDNQIIVSDSSILSNAEVRALFSASNAGGDGSLAYDSLTGVFTYTGVTAAETRAHLSNTAPIQYDSVTGVISIDEAAVFAGKTTDDLAEGTTNLYFSNARVDARVPTSILNGDIQLEEVRESVYTFPTPQSGNINLGLTAGTVFKATLNGDITNIYFTHERPGAFATFIVTQDGSGNHELLANSFTSTFSWAGNVSTINPTAGSTSYITITYDGSQYYGSVTTFVDEPALTTDDVAEGVTNLYLNGAGTSDDLTEGTTNLFFTTSAANTAISNYTGNIAGPVGFINNTRFYSNIAVRSSGQTNPNAGLNIKIINPGINETMEIENENANISFWNGYIRNTFEMVDPWVKDGNANTAYIRFADNDLYRLGASATGVLQWSDDGGSTFYPLPKSTDDLPEGTNLYLNGSGTSDDLTEGSTNLFFTYNNANTWLATKTTDDLTEGSTNLYFSNANLISGIENNEIILKQFHETEGTVQGPTSGNITLDFSEGTASAIILNGDITGITLSNIDLGIGATEFNTYKLFITNQFGSEELDTTTYPSNWTKWNFVNNDTTISSGASAFTLLTITADINEQIFAKVERIQDFTTDDVPEGSTNLYYSNALVEAYLSSNVSTIDADVITANSFVGGTFTGDGSDLTDVRAQSVEEKVKNVSGGTLAKGTPVYATGVSTSDVQHVDACDASDPAKMPCIGVLATELDDDEEGRAIITGKIAGVDTSTFTAGDQIFIAVGGGYANTAPTGEGNIIQFLGTVTLSDASGGGIVKIAPPRATPNLDDGAIFVGSSTNESVAVDTTNNFAVSDTTFDLSNTLSNVNTITTEDATGFTVNSRDGIVFKQEFSVTDTEVANISGDGFAFRNNNLYTNQLSYSGTDPIVAYKFNGNITSGSNEIVISSVNRYQDDAASAVSDLVAGMVYAEGTTLGNQPKGFARTAYVQSVDSANSKVIMSETAQATLSVTDSTFWHAMIDTSRGQVVQIRSDYDQSAGSNTSVQLGLPTNPDAYGYPSTGFSASDFDVFSAGSDTDYTWDANVANFMVGRTAFAAEGTAPKFINGLVVGENTSLTNRAENDSLESFGINVMWDGISSAGSTSKIPQILMKSYTDNTLATQNNAINQSQKSLAGPRLFFTSADGNADDYAFGTYPKVNQELGRIAWWGSNAENLTPSSVYTPALISVIPHDNWETAGDSALDPAGNADMYFASTVDNTKGADVFMSYQGGKLTLASGKRADEDRHGIYFAPAEQNKKLMPKAIGLTYYEGNSKYWTKIGPANIAGDEGSQLTVTNGGDRGTTVGDLKMSIHRQNDPNVEFSVHGVFDAALAIGPSGYGQIAITVPDELSNFIQGSLVSFSGTFEESATGNENALSGNTYRLFFAANVGGDIGYDIYLVYTTGFTPLTYTAIGGSTPYPATAPQVNYVDAPRVSVTNTQSAYSDKEWTLELNYPNDELNLKVDGSTVIEYSNVSTTFTNIPVMPSYSNTALPSSIAGGQIYITNGNNKPAYGDGTNWYYFDNTQVT